MTKDTRAAVAGVLVAIGITSAMDATGYSQFSALPLAPLLAIFAYLQRQPRRALGFVWGRGRDYGLAILYPIVVLGVLTLIARLSNVIDVSHTNWKKACINLVLVSISNTLVVIITDEGFFRGWFWASLERGGIKLSTVWIWSSIAFAAWHWSAISLKTGFDVPARQIPLFLINAAVMGAEWGLLRWISGSVVVSSMSHGVWNAFAYVLFGFGTRIGALGIKQTAVYGPEVGIVGLVLNIVFVIGLWSWWRSQIANRPQPEAESHVTGA